MGEDKWYVPNWLKCLLGANSTKAICYLSKTDQEQPWEMLNTNLKQSEQTMDVFQLPMSRESGNML